MFKQALWAGALISGLAVPAMAQQSVPQQQTPAGSQSQPAPQTQQVPSAQQFPSQPQETTGTPDPLAKVEGSQTRSSPQPNDAQQSSRRHAGWRGERDADDEDYDEAPPRRFWHRWHRGWDDDGRYRWGGRRFGQGLRDDWRRWHRDESRQDESRQEESRRDQPRENMAEAMPAQRPHMPRFGMAALCGPDGTHVAGRMINRIERATQPNADQRANFDKLKDAVGNATEIMRAACTADRPISPPARLAAAEKRLSAMLEAVRTVRPALDSYYESLNDEQKLRLTLAQRHMLRQRLGELHQSLGESWRGYRSRERNQMRDSDRENHGNTGSDEDDDDDDDSDDM